MDDDRNDITELAKLLLTDKGLTPDEMTALSSRLITGLSSTDVELLRAILA